MSLLNPQANALWLNAVLFVGAAGLIWYAGTRLERLADAIATRTGLGHAFIGVVLLATATSLPEIASVSTAALIGNPALAVHNLLGAIVFNTAIMAIADVVSGKEAVSHRSPRFVLLIQGLGVVGLLAAVLAAGAVARGFEVPQRGGAATLVVVAWVGGLVLAYLGVVYLTYRGQTDPRWKPARAEPPAGPRAAGEPGPYADRSARAVYLGFAAASLGVLAGGYTVARTGDALAQQTGLGGGFVGFALLSVATTLPELSTTTAAARAGNDEMAFANVFGSCAVNVTLLALVGALAGAEVVSLAGSPSAAFAAALGIVAVSCYLWGLLERRDRTILRMGMDSFAVLVLAAVGTAVMYFLE